MTKKVTWIASKKENFKLQSYLEFINIDKQKACQTEVCQIAPVGPWQNCPASLQEK